MGFSENQVGVEPDGGGDFFVVGVDILTTRIILTDSETHSFKNFRLRRSYLSVNIS